MAAEKKDRREEGLLFIFILFIFKGLCCNRMVMTDL